MRSITVAVIIAGLASYLGGYSPPTPLDHSVKIEALATENPPLNSEPDDEESDRIHPRTRRNIK
jgi:hypothetical protein